ncbi:MAG: hypothetical protein PG977_000802 [Bartonella clarridgeiae]|nr:MAG: hypothetical protein PG977_000802 [Bartonella clarridgeiae]
MIAAPFLGFLCIGLGDDVHFCSFLVVTGFVKAYSFLWNMVI